MSKTKRCTRPVRCPFCKRKMHDTRREREVYLIVTLHDGRRAVDRPAHWSCWRKAKNAVPMERLIREMLRGFEDLFSDHWAKIDAREWASTFRRRAAKLGITAKETKP